MTWRMKLLDEGGLLIEPAILAAVQDERRPVARRHAVGGEGALGFRQGGYVVGAAAHAREELLDELRGQRIVERPQRDYGVAVAGEVQRKGQAEQAFAPRHWAEAAVGRRD